MSEQNPAGLTFKEDGTRLMRRVAGYHDMRLDGMSDLLSRARDATVFDIGCNRGLAGFEFAYNGAKRVYGCDIYEDGITCARHLFCDLRAVRHRFEVVDLTGGPAAIKKAFGGEGDWSHDIMLLLATFHKLRRVMPESKLNDLVRWFGSKTTRYFAWRGYESEIPILDEQLGMAGLMRIHTSLMSDIQPCAVWARK